MYNRSIEGSYKELYQVELQSWRRLYRDLTPDELVVVRKEANRCRRALLIVQSEGEDMYCLLRDQLMIETVLNELEDKFNKENNDEEGAMISITTFEEDDEVAKSLGIPTAKKICECVNGPEKENNNGQKN